LTWIFVHGPRVPSYATARDLCFCLLFAPNREQNGRTNRRAVSSMDLVGKKPCINWGPTSPEGKRNFVEHDDSTMNIVVVIKIIFMSRYTDTFCNAVDCRFELALEVQKWAWAP